MSAPPTMPARRGWAPAGWRPDDRLDSHEALREVARHLAFRQPGWRVEWRPNPMPLESALEPCHTYLVLVCRTVDTYTYRPGDEGRPHKQILIQHVRAVPEWMRVADLPEWFRHQVFAALTHEADEWLRVDGWMLWNPHGDPKQVEPPDVPFVASFTEDPTAPSVPFWPNPF